MYPQLFIIMTRKTSTYDRLGELTVLQGFLEAKLWMAIDEWFTLSTMDCYDDANVIKGRLIYARNQISVLKQLIRDAANPERTLKRWLKHLDQQKENTTPTADVQSATDSGQRS